MINLWQQSVEQYWQMIARRWQISKMRATSIQPIWFTQSNSWPHSEIGQAGLTCHSSHRKLHSKVNWKSPRRWPNGDTIPLLQTAEMLDNTVTETSIYSIHKSGVLLKTTRKETLKRLLDSSRMGFVMANCLRSSWKNGTRNLPTVAHSLPKEVSKKSNWPAHCRTSRKIVQSLNTEDKVNGKAQKVQLWWSEIRKNLGRIPPEEYHLQYNATFFWGVGGWGGGG